MKGIYKKFFLIAILAIIIFYFIFNSVSYLEIYKPDSQHIIKLLKQHNKNKQHPRLMATSKDFENIKLEINKDKEAKERFIHLKQQADTMLKQEPFKYELTDELRLLTLSRQVLYRIQTLAFVYQISGQKKYADRAWFELEAISNDEKFPDWHPVQFLDTAEMTNAAAIGYDWLYNYLTDSQKLLIRNAILTKGLKPAMEFSKKENSPMNGNTNWNSVCNGGIGLGALAIGDEGGEFETISGKILENSIKYLPKMLNEYSPDGAWYEGPGYWDYATTYFAYFISALDSTLGTDYNLSKASGLSSTGYFPIYMTGPGGTFNFADSSSDELKSPVLLWLANKFSNGEYAWYYDNKIATIKNITPMTFIWGNKKVKKVPIKKQDEYFRKSEVVALHSSLSKNTDSFIGFKTGTNGLSHNDLDIGTFVYDSLGIRWFCDLGADNYNLKGYGDMQDTRWQYYRKRAEGHNTLVINPNLNSDQNIYAKTKIETFKSSPRKSFAIADITDAYKSDAMSVKRGVALYKGTKTMLIQDEIITYKPSDIWWFAHTQAKIEINRDKKSAILSKNGKKILVSILSPADGYFNKMEAEPLPSSPNPNNQTYNNMEKLTIHLANVDDTTITVVISPLVDDENLSLPNLVKLQDWDIYN